MSVGRETIWLSHRIRLHTRQCSLRTERRHAREPRQWLKCKAFGDDCIIDRDMNRSRPVTVTVSGCLSSAMRQTVVNA
jgi:hypothetical protein